MKYSCSISMVFISLILHGCTIAKYELREELSGVATPAPCQIIYYLEVESAPHTSTIGSQSARESALVTIIDSYNQTTKETLDDLGCSYIQVLRPSDANFTVNVSRQLQLSALPQEWLTGLSLGIIPSWGVKQGQYIYTFTHTASGESHRYHVDQHNYNHITLLPFFWITLFTADEQRAYQHAFTNFIKSTER